MTITSNSFWCRSVRLSLVATSDASDTIRDIDPNVCIKFDVEKTRSSEPNHATIEIYNLSQDTRNRFGEEFNRIRLIGGHTPNGIDKTDILFDGNIRRFFHARVDADIVTTIIAGDGDLDYRNSTVNRTFPAGTSYREVIDYIRSRMPNIGVGNLSGVDKMGAVDKAYTISGWAKRYLDEICRKFDVRWSIQNGLMEIIDNNQSINRTIPVLTPRTGLIGIPVVTEHGINITAMLNPAIQPNTYVEVQSLTRDTSNEAALATETDAGAGVYRINNARFYGSNFDNDFYISAECQRMTDGRVIRPANNDYERN